MPKSLGCVVLALLPVGIMPAAQLKDDYLIAVERTALNIEAATLMANDTLVPGPVTSQVEIVTAPRVGTVVRTNTGLVYHAKEGAGSDSFTYRVVTGNVVSLPATVHINVAPRYQAFRGDFDGDGVRTWGWFDSASAAFYAWPGAPNEGIPLLLWQAPPELAGRTPVVGDWNKDGLTDVGLFDSANGWFHVVTFAGRTRIGLTEKFSFALGKGGHSERPVAGDWNNDGHDSVGLHRFAEVRFLLRNRNSTGPADYDFVIQDLSPSAPQALAAGLWWNLAQRDAIALHIDNRLHLYVPGTAWRGVRNTACWSDPAVLPVELDPENGLFTFNLINFLGTICDRANLPVDVYIPPDGG